MNYQSSYGKELEGIFLRIKSKKLLHEFLIDLLSPAEYKDLAMRWQIMKMLEKGISQRDIARRLKVSVATIARGSKELLNKKGGFAKMLRN